MLALNHGPSRPPVPIPVAGSTTSVLPTIVLSTLPTLVAATPRTIAASTANAPASLNFHAIHFMLTTISTDLPASMPADCTSATELLVGTTLVFIEITLVNTENAQPAGLTTTALPRAASIEAPRRGATLDLSAGPFNFLVTSVEVSTNGLLKQEQSNTATASTSAPSTVPVEPRARTSTPSTPEATYSASLPVTIGAPSLRFTETTITQTVTTTPARMSAVVLITSFEKTIPPR
ncbi:hypothetical protein MRX96_000978 [Rhipicephalus microplus]